MGLAGGHIFSGKLSVTVGSGALEGDPVAERSMVSEGPLAVLRPPSAGTRALYEWGVDATEGFVRPLVEGEASLWDRQIRRCLLSNDDAAD